MSTQNVQSPSPDRRSVIAVDRTALTTVLSMLVGTMLFVILMTFKGAVRPDTTQVTLSNANAVKMRMFAREALEELYIPSPFETTWMSNAKDWGAVHDTYCSKVLNFPNEIVHWLNVTDGYIIEVPGSPVTATPKHDDVFSVFNIRYACGGHEQLFKSSIEPLAFGLRHPLGGCYGGDAWLLARNFIQVISADELYTTSCGVTTIRKFLFDLGASTWTTGGGGVSQKWFVDEYGKQGIRFDRMLMWEARPLSGTEIFAAVPHDVLPAFQFFNVPATTNRSDPSNPLNILKAITTPDDFVVLKIDIDNSPIEKEFIKQLLEDVEISSRVDEFFFENHVNFDTMLRGGWGGGGYSKEDGLYESYQLFRKLRDMGIRAHSWP